MESETVDPKGEQHVESNRAYRAARFWKTMHIP
jgi:hypothetical protein